MTNRITLLTLVAAAHLSPVIADEKTESPKPTRSIELKPSKPQFVLGRAIDLRVVYSNPTGEPWKLEQPESSAGVKVWYVRTGEAKPLRMGFSFSKMTATEVRLSNGTQQVVYSGPPRTEIEIPPGGKHELTADIYSKWTEDLAPGEYQVWVEDAGQKLQSNRCRFSLAFTKESVPALLETAAVEKEMPAKRKWCARWLQRIQPDFELKLKEAKTPPEAAKKIAEENAAAIRGFKAHWEKVKDSREIETLFTKPAPEPRAGQTQQPQSLPTKKDPL